MLDAEFTGDAVDDRDTGAADVRFKLDQSPLIEKVLGEALLPTGRVGHCAHLRIGVVPVGAARRATIRRRPFKVLFAGKLIESAKPGFHVLFSIATRWGLMERFLGGRLGFVDFQRGVGFQGLLDKGFKLGHRLLQHGHGLDELRSEPLLHPHVLAEYLR